MSKSPIKREAGQTAEEMAAQMSPEGNRLYNPKKGNYAEVSAQVKAEMLDAVIDQQIALLHRCKVRGRVDLNNVDEVEACAVEYMQACKLAGVFPSLMGFAASTGYSRKHLYEFIRNNPNKLSAQYLDSLRSAWAAVIQEMGLRRAASEAVTIFLLKNCGQGLADHTEYDITARRDDTIELTVEQIMEKYKDLPGGDDEEEEEIRSLWGETTDDDII